MARFPRRSVPPVLDDPRAAQLTLAQQRTLLLLPLALDDAGRGLDDPGTLNGLLWGRFWEEHPPSELDADLAALAAAGFVVRYELDGVRYLAMLDWEEQQVVSRRQPSRFPAPPGGGRSKAWAGAGRGPAGAGGAGDPWSSVDGLMNVFGGAAGRLHDPQVQARGVRMLADLAGQIDPALGAKVRDRARSWVGTAADDPVHPDGGFGAAGGEHGEHPTVQGEAVRPAPTARTAPQDPAAPVDPAAQADAPPVPPTPPSTPEAPPAPDGEAPPPVPPAR
ncbi:hypothetical protein [Vallicoccus soli]|uniref:hypothetical protein n=1 Tax=Vallicoccus soli TaxID=2339232 RepID=UPI00105A3CEB|nr:hypothetical protein [Vallicoccus soli]